MSGRLARYLYFLKTGYLFDGERVNPDFPDANFQNHLKVYKFLAQFAASKDVLDVGCGTGYGTAHLAEVARSAVGIDISQPAIRWARKRYPHVKYIQMDVQHLEFADDSFDLIVSSENFEHLLDQAGHARELARVLRPDGMCFVASPNPEMFVGVVNPFHTKENTLGELRDLFVAAFDEVTVLENSLAPSTAAGLAMREDRWSKGFRGDPIPSDQNNAWMHNTHSFFCLLRKPRKLQPASVQPMRDKVRS